jgi:hypothetical protein
MSNESAVENFEGLQGKIDAQGLRITDLEVFTEQTHNRVNDVEALRSALRELQDAFTAERNDVNVKFVALEFMIKQNVLDAVAKISAVLIANALRDDVVSTIKEEITAAATVLASTVIVTRQATREDLRGKS